MNNFKDALEIFDDNEATEMLSNLELTSLREPTVFTCNSCGECCRTRIELIFRH